jgi:hypothetical protein
MGIGGSRTHVRIGAGPPSGTFLSGSFGPSAGENWGTRKPCSAMTPYLIAAREGIICSVKLALMPVEVVFDWLEDEIERRP